MDDLKAIPMMEKFFYELAGPAEQTPTERTDRYVSMRKAFEKVLDWYAEQTKDKFALEKSEKGEFTVNPVTKARVYAELPKTTGIEQLAKYEPGMWSWLNDFNKRGVVANEIRNHIEGYLDQIKNGWGYKLKKKAQTGEAT